MQTTPTLLSGPTRNPFTDYYPWNHDPFCRQPASFRQSQDSSRSISLDTGIMNGSSFFDVINHDHQSSSSEQSQYYQSPREEEQPSDLRLSVSASSSNSQPLVLSSSPAAQFLSAFSSPPKIQAALPDDEGQAVGGYTLGSVIGYGAFSAIRRACSASGGVVAVKIVRGHDISKLPNAAQTKKRLDREVAAWSSLSHEHILPLFSAVHTSYADYFFTLYCPAGSLFDILKRDGRPALPHDDAGTMFRQVVRGLRYMHEVAGYVHRDMKLENVLVDEMGICRIGDFGMSCKIGYFDEESEDDNEDELEWQSPTPHSGVHRAASMAVPASKRHATSLSVTRHGSVRYRNSPPSRNPKLSNPGSLPYAAPELLLPRTTPLRPHPSQDIWALGVMLYALLVGRLPFSDSYEPRLQVKITSGVYDIPSDIGRGAEQVLKGCLEPNVSARWTITMVDDVAWGIGWKTEEDDDEALPQSRSDLFDPDRALPKKTSKHAAIQRSDSRRRHSLSRSPASGGPPGSKGERRRSRATSPLLGSLETAVLSNDTLSGSSSFSPASEPALLLSPSSSLERGRKPTKVGVYFSSRSPSPSMVPRTPVDSATRFRSPLAEENKSETTPRRHAAVHSFHNHPHFVPDDAPIPETGVLDWTAEGRPFVSFFDDESPSRCRVERSASLGWRVDGGMADSSPERTTVSRSKKRAGSTPPRSLSVALLPPWTTPESRGRMPGALLSTAEDHRFLKPLGTAPIMSVSKKPAPLPRSKSAGHARYEHDLYALRPRMTDL